jgi:peptidoglycan/LPS O-acetylase OafA/YrhL
LLYLGGTGEISSFGSARPFWTLAIEWWIYMAFGWIALRNRARSGIVFFVVLAVLAVVPAYNILGGRGNGLGLVWIFGATLCLIASNRRISEIRTDTLALAAIGFGTLSVILLRSTLEPYDPKYAALFGASLLCAVLAVDRVRWKAPAALAGAVRFIANYSFTLYLLHYSILDLMVHHRVVGEPLGDFVLAVVVTNLVSIAVAYFTEFKHRAFAGWLKRKFLAPQS